MYWTHLIFSLFVCFIANSDWTGGTKPGWLDFDNLPETNFSCDGKVIGGYYADVETGCQMFHVCTIGQKAEVTDIKFLCLNGTVFDQETRVCERIDEVDCSKSEDFFGLNLELYGNNGNLGIQPENEFDCEDCSTDEDYDELTTTTTTSSTTTTSTTTTTTPAPPKVHFPSSSPETLVALLALHNAFSQSLNGKKPPPPRVINNAFASKFTTQRPKEYEYLNQPPKQKPFYLPTTPVPKSNYHHFHSGDASFGHSFDQSKPYNFQYFHSRRLEEPKVSIVTSTSTSTSVKTSKPNVTDFPTGYDEYSDEIEDSFFHDVPKIRSKREERFANHKYPDEIHQNHKYENREEFLQNLLGSIDMDEHDRQKMAVFFKKEEEQMDMGGMMQKLGDKLGQMIMDDVNKTIHLSKNNNTFDLDELSLLWKQHYEEMSQEVKLDFGTNRQKRETTSEHPRRRNRTQKPSYKPVSEEIQDDLTTLPYRRMSQMRRISTIKPDSKGLKFNYETSKNPPEETTLTYKADQHAVPVYEIAQTTQVPKRRSRGKVRGTLREPVTSTTTIRTIDPNLKPDPDFSCEGKVKGGFYADIVSDCRGFFICSQGQINGPLLKSHFWCGATTKFNQRSRTCQADYLVECSISKRYFHLNDDFLVPESESDLKGPFEPMKVKE